VDARAGTNVIGKTILPSIGRGDAGTTGAVLRTETSACRIVGIVGFCSIKRRRVPRIGKTTR
jgi:hypothetical protein